MTIGLYLLRAFQIGMSIDDLESMSVGMMLDIITEHSNDSYEYTPLATQKDMDAFR